MADNLNFVLVYTERRRLSEKVSEVVIPATEGEMTVMANHAPVMTTVKPGVVTVKSAAGTVSRYVVFGGFADILPTGCTLLAESAIPVESLSADVLSARIAAAREDLSSAGSDDDKSRIEQFLAELTHLNGVVIPA